MREQKYRRMAIQILYFKSGLQPDLAKPTNGNHHFLYKQKSLEKQYLALTLLMFIHVLYITL